VEVEGTKLAILVLKVKTKNMRFQTNLEFDFRAV
jgi:hypothetical protein